MTMFCFVFLPFSKYCVAVSIIYYYHRSVSINPFSFYFSYFLTISVSVAAIVVIRWCWFTKTSKKCESISLSILNIFKPTRLYYVYYHILNIHHEYWWKWWWFFQAKSINSLFFNYTSILYTDFPKIENCNVKSKYTMQY